MELGLWQYYRNEMEKEHIAGYKAKPVKKEKAVRIRVIQKLLILLKLENIKRS